MDTRPLSDAGPVLVKLPAEIDITNANDVRWQITGAFMPGVSVVIADMTTTSFCDSTGAGVLMRACTEAAKNGTEVRLLKPPRRDAGAGAAGT
jgi:anti-anti-sigma factor